ALTRIGLHGLYGLVVRVLHLNCKLGKRFQLKKLKNFSIILQTYITLQKGQKGCEGLVDFL
ncbi:hypothetical protein, partial [Lacticaseibacillus paracasei]|uniref:hypothetical protein n=1 Tax=Lacticaseibacillus paracasei TaxID=1597 RepID=UPI0025A0BD69